MPDAYWAKHAVEVLASRGVITGVSAKQFMPDQKITHADYALLLVRALGLSGAGENSFLNVAQDDYFYGELMTANKLGIVNGQADGRFQPKQSISRQEMFVITARALRAAGLWNSMPETSGAVSAVASVPAASRAVSATASVPAASRAFSGAAFAPAASGAVSAAASVPAASGAVSAVASVPAASFSDQNHIALYAAEDIAAPAAAGYLQGDTRQQLNPTAYSTRAEAAVLLYRILGLE
nr:S-layer homology domain-containing protein [Paenibacillus donghaensis]